MSDFTEKQELEIINSPDFAKFLEERRAAGSDRISIDDFLDIAGNQAKWEKRFAQQTAEQEDAKKPELTLETMQQYLDALETTTDSTNDTALNEYFENLQKDSHDTLNSIATGAWVFAPNTYNTPEAYETTKKFIEDMVGGYFETSVGGQNNDVRLKEVHDKALVMLDAARLEYEKSKQTSNDDFTNADTIVVDNPTNDDDSNVDNIIPPLPPIEEEKDDADGEEEKKQGIGNIYDEPVNPPVNPIEEKIEKLRLLSMITDDNRIVFNGLQLDVLEAIEIISADNANEARQNLEQGNPDRLFDLVEQADGLSGDKRREYDVKIAESILNNEKNTEWAPPSVLADIHDSLKKHISEDKKKDENADVSSLQELLDKANVQIDKLSEDMSKKRGYHYSDIINIADIYNGYAKMFTARKADFSDSPTPEEQAKITQMDGNISTLSEIRKEYDTYWGIENVTQRDDSRISEAYDKAFHQMENMTLDDETLALLKNVTFLNAEGGAEAQFSDAGEIIEGSKLDKLIKLTANDVAMKAMAGEKELTAEQLRANLQETLLTNLYAVNAFEKSYNENGAGTVLVEKDELTPSKNAADVQQFKALLENEEAITISDAAYVGWKRRNINSAKGLAERLSEKLEAKNATAVEKIYGRVASIDGVSGKGERPREKMSAKEFRKYAAKRLLKDFSMSAGIGMGFTILTGALRAKAGATLATVVGVGVGVTATAAMIWKRKKDAKKKGEKYGWRQFFKDPQAMIAVATTALASAAVATAPISPRLSGLLGYSAIALGTGGKGIDMFQKSQNDAAGISKWEGFLWAAADAGVTFGGVMAGKAAGQAAINAWNNAFPDNHLFRENAGVEARQGEEIVETKTHVERHYDPEVVETYKNACQNWVDNETLMKMHNDAIAKGMTSDEFWVKAHHSIINNPEGVPAEFGTNRAYVDNTVTGTDFKTVDDLKIIHSDNHNLMGELARQEFNFSLDSQKAAASFLDFQHGSVNVAPEVNDALHQFDDIANRVGGVGNVSSTPHIVNHLGENAGYNPETQALELNAPEGSERTWTSYANSDSIYTDETVTTTDVVGHKVEFVDKTETVKGIPALVGLVNAGRKFKDRIGALADSFLGKKKKMSELQQEPKAQLQQQEPKTQLQQQEPKTSLTQDEVNEMLDKEYQIVHGHKPSERERARYKQLVQKEWLQESTPSADFWGYMQQRMDTFETMIGTAKEPLAESNQGLSDKYKDDINQARQRMWQLPQGERGTADVTLTDFRQHMAKCLSNDGQLRAEVSGRQIDSKKAPVINKRNEGSSL